MKCFNCEKNYEKLQVKYCNEFQCDFLLKCNKRTFHWHNVCNMCCDLVKTRKTKEKVKKAPQY